jgi:hypothetical protein
MRHLIDPEIDTDEDKDLPLERRMESMGKTAIIYPTDPHGFWRVRMERTKNIPPQLEGCYTGIGEAEKAVKAYFNLLKAEAKPKGAIDQGLLISG